MSFQLDRNDPRHEGGCKELPFISIEEYNKLSKQKQQSFIIVDDKAYYFVV